MGKPKYHEKLGQILSAVNHIPAARHRRCCRHRGTVRPIAVFFVTTTAGLVLYIVLIITPFIVLFPLYYYHQKHPMNYLLLGVFTVAISFAVGLTCAFTSGKCCRSAPDSLNSVLGCYTTHSSVSVDAGLWNLSVQPLLVQVLMWIHLLTLKIMKKKAVKLKLVKRMMVQVRWKDLFDRARLMWVY
ncbi:hypothetical protein LINPERHAP1_LOCUS13001 [Linum perenne]